MHPACSRARAWAACLPRASENIPARGQDETGKVIELCNDGNVYCGITTFDWTQPKVRELWVRAVQNATETGHVDGIFADHSGTCERRSACHTALVVLTQGGWWWQGVTA